MPYLNPPLLGFTGTDGTSREAAEAVNPERREQVLDVIKRFGAAGATPDEVAKLLGWDVTSVRPRFTELRSQRRIIPTGRRRKTGHGGNAAVCIAVEKTTT